MVGKSCVVNRRPEIQRDRASAFISLAATRSFRPTLIVWINSGEEYRHAFEGLSRYRSLIFSPSPLTQAAEELLPAVAGLDSKSFQLGYLFSTYHLPCLQR